MSKWYSLGLNNDDKERLKEQIKRYYYNAPDNNYGMKLPGNRLKRTGGAIKMRFSSDRRNRTKGKSGSYRIIYFVAVRTNLYFLDVYSKNRQVALSNSQDNKIRKLIKYIDNKG